MLRYSLLGYRTGITCDVCSLGQPGSSTAHCSAMRCHRRSSRLRPPAQRPSRLICADRHSLSSKPRAAPVQTRRAPAEPAKCAMLLEARAFRACTAQQQARPAPAPVRPAARCPARAAGPAAAPQRRHPRHRAAAVVAAATPATAAATAASQRRRVVAAAATPATAATAASQLPRSPGAMVDQAAAAVQAGLDAGQLRQMVTMLLPVRCWCGSGGRAFAGLQQ